MHPLTELIRSDMKPALGVTEPGAIAYAVATARSRIGGEIEKVEVALNSGIYKNAYSCGIPNSRHLGNLYAAALGAVAADASRGLECLAAVTAEDNRRAEALVDAGKVAVTMSEVSSRIHIRACVRTDAGEAAVTIWDAHTNITRIAVNGVIVLDRPVSEVPAGDEGQAEPQALIHRYTLAEILAYVRNVPAEEIAFIREAYRVNLALYAASLESERTIYAQHLYEQNGRQSLSTDERASASLLCNGAIEARVLGLDRPAMSITGSGAHGIIATLPLYAVCRIRGYADNQLYRATALSYLLCMYIKEYSGKLSAFCGCAIAAGTGMASALTYLGGGDEAAISRCISNMASSITGMICDGGNHGCTVKGIVAVDAAFRARDLALAGVCLDSIHGINGRTAEETMRNMGRIASPGMVATEGTIVEIMTDKDL